ncbi:PulJ/GspJ family protein [Aestuariibaculum sediminum]|uniref:Prepilin-type N-terminal cleavage/methylation domain-containing protein n=1 Tax=Aestuariibaculum sediminum TaxID=2770637 RepID=A0A8J6Q9P3_9FLAO|nr:hypothetical protein [Aestuariibaculum sediminum]MBD0833795.1 hypothetical protein [Aestuariibaculum sediminum]
MYIDKKLNSFTLGEMVVVLIITSIVVGMAFSVLSLVQNQIQSIRENFNNDTELSRLEQSLLIDFNKYSKVEFHADEHKMVLKHELDSVSYQLNESFLIKSEDTFKVSVKNFKLFFDGNGVQEGVLDAIRLETLDSPGNNTLFVYKINDATPFIN